MLRLYYQSLFGESLRHTWSPVLYLIAVHHVNRFMYTQDGTHTKLKRTMLTQILRAKNQVSAGFSSGYSTTDHIFTLHALTEILKSRNKKLFCAYIDFQKAFDSVWRIGLWMKLLGNSINGKCFKIIYNLYQNIKSGIKYSGKQSAFVSKP